MKTSFKSLRPMKRHLLIKTLLTCLVLAAFSLAALPISAADAEAEAKKKFEAWRAAAADVATAKKDLKDAKDALEIAMAAAALSGKKITAAQEAQLANARAKVAEDEAALQAAEKRLDAAREELEKAISELPDDSEVKKELKRLRDALMREQTQVISQLTKTAGGLQVTTFDTLQGRVIVNLPDDMRAGDTISGTVMVEPKGKTSEEKESNSKLIEAWAVELDGVRATTSKPHFTWTPRMPLTPGEVRYQLKIVEILPGQTPSERTIAIAQLPGMTPSRAVINPDPRIQQPTLPSAAVITLDPLIPKTPTGAVITANPSITSGFQVPALGQAGRPIIISGPFDGSFENTNLSVGGEKVPILAESPRKMVFESPTNRTGPTEITLKEGNVETTSTYRNVGVNLTAPKTNLTKGESTTLTVTVEGLEGIKSSVPLHLDNLVPSVVKMEGGDAQTRSIKPAEVKADGTYQINRAIKGQQAGAFRVTATVVVFDVCLQDDDNGNSLLVSSTTGDYIFCSVRRAGMSPISINTIEDFSGGVTLATGSGGDSAPPRAWFILEHNTTDRRVLINLNAGFQSGNATVETAKPKQTFTITDRDTRNNTCTCGGGTPTQQEATEPSPIKFRTFPGDYGSREGDKCEHGGKIVWRRHQTYNCVVKEISQVECGETKEGKDSVKDLEKFVKKNGKEWGKGLLSKATAAADAIKAVVTIYRTADLYIHVVRPWEDVDITYECRGGVWVSIGSEVVASGEDDLGWHKLMVPHGGTSLCWTGTESVGELQEAVTAAFGAVCAGEAVIVK